MILSRNISNDPIITLKPLNVLSSTYLLCFSTIIKYIQNKNKNTTGLDYQIQRTRTLQPKRTITGLLQLNDS